jgi:cytochrome c peroxidase
MIKLFLINAILIITLVAQSTHKSEWSRPPKVPVPKDNPLSKEKIILGKKLFFDPILSRANNISCMSCHNPLKGWSDGDKIAIGDKGQLGTRNTPTLLNSAYQHVYFWDGRAKSLETQALSPLTTHAEMNLDPKEAVKKLKSMPAYMKMFEKAFPNEGITVETLASALASFERTIVSGESRFDKYITGDKTLLSDEERKGFQTFVNKGNCIICHSGFNFTDQSFNNVGIDNGDHGRGNIKKRPIWQDTFKTPTLRNIALTGPYFHDGSVEKLKDAVAFCAKGQRDKKSTVSPTLIDKHLSEQEISNIVSFLHTLSEPVTDLDP